MSDDLVRYYAAVRRRMAAATRKNNMSNPSAIMLQAQQFIDTERCAQESKWGEQNRTPADWMLIFMEEVGEFSKEVLEDNGVCAMEELVQVAAVAKAMVECGFRNHWGDKLPTS